ncbi:MAG: isocitrate/isopropylmalate family dehydrogenase, partial [Microbacteriaceae bacterium]
MTTTVKLGIIPGDGIGKEVTEQSLRVLKAVTENEDIELVSTEYPFGAEHYLETGHILDEADLAELASNDVILFGAVGGNPTEPKLAGGIIERGLLLKLRFAFDHYINLRPSTLFAGTTSTLANPGTIDFLVVREGTEGPYVGNGGSIRKDTPQEVANEVSVNTAFGVERTVRFAFEQASKRRQKLTLVHKTNVLVYAGTLWQRTFD